MHKIKLKLILNYNINIFISFILYFWANGHQRMVYFMWIVRELPSAKQRAQKMLLHGSSKGRVERGKITFFGTSMSRQRQYFNLIYSTMLQEVSFICIKKVDIIFKFKYYLSQFQ